jgi:hypothetical protein
MDIINFNKSRNKKRKKIYNIQSNKMRNQYSYNNYYQMPEQGNEGDYMVKDLG